MNATRRIGASLVVLLCILLLTSSAYAGEYQYASCWRELLSIPDPSPVNLTDARALWDYRDTGRTQDTGAYFHVYVAVIPKAGSHLPDYNAVASAIREVKVKHLQTGREFTSETDPCLNFVGVGRYYDVFLRPEDWVFESTWEITMIYQGTDKLLHRQTLSDIPSGPNIWPPVPTGIEITPSGDYVSVSWDAAPFQSLPPDYTSYRLRIYDSAGFCAYDYAWVPDASGHIVSNPTNPKYPPITPDLIGRTLRLENRWYKPTAEDPGAFARAVKFSTLDYTSPNP